MAEGGDIDQEDLLRIGIAAMTKQLDRYADTKLRAKRMQEATEEATVLEKQKQKRREDHEATSSLASSRRTEKIAHKKEKSAVSTSGAGWFNLKSTPLTPETKRDLQVLGLRNYIDKTRKYKRATERPNRIPKFFQIGTVVAGPTDYYSMDGPAKGLKNKSIAEQLLASSEQRKWRKKKYLEVQTSHSSGGKKDYQKLAKSRKPKWAPTKM